MGQSLVSSEVQGSMSVDETKLPSASNQAIDKGVTVLYIQNAPSVSWSHTNTIPA